MTIDTFNDSIESINELLQSGGNYDSVEQQARALVAAVAEELESHSNTEALQTVRLEEIRIRALLALSTAYWRRGMGKDAIAPAEQALVHSQNEFHRVELPTMNLLYSKSFRNLGHVYWTLNDFSKALEYYQRALDLDITLNNRTGIAENTGNVGMVYFSLSQYEKALEYYNKALALDVEQENKIGIANGHGNIGLVYAILSDYATAFEHYNIALLNDEELGNIHGVALHCGNIGNVYYYSSDYSKALEFYHRSLQLCEQLGDLAGTSRASCNIGMVHAAMSDNAIALEYFRNAMSLDETSGYKTGLSTAIGNVGSVYLHQNELSTAIEYFERALNIARDIGDARQCGYWLTSLGLAHYNLGRNTEALEYYNQVLHIRKVELRASEGIEETLLAIGSLLVSEKKFTEAEQYLNDALASSTDHGTRQVQFQIHEALSGLYAEKGEFETSLEHYRLFHQIKEEVHSEKTRLRASYLDIERRNNQRERDLAIERSQAAATESILHRILPTSVAARLIRGEKVADHFPSVSILFADIVGFTAIASEIPPDIVIDLLNTVFDRFDVAVRRHGCEKVKTIGDGYMVVAGAPEECSDHAEKIARVAIEMLSEIALPPEISSYLPANSRFGVRVGIHTGSVICGILGTERFVWDVYSDAVNVASRMESTGEPGKIHVSKDFVWLLRSRSKMTPSGNQFSFIERGDVDIKGKGLMKTYFLENAE